MTGNADRTPPAEQGRAAGLRVLVADDYPDAAESLAILLAAAGFEVRTAKDGEEARQLVARWQPEVCVLDLSMPALDGCDLARWIRAHCRYEQPMLIALTGWGRPDDQERVRDAGFDSHFMKPAEPSELVRALELETSKRRRTG